MASQDASTDQAWAKLADLNVEECEPRMRERYQELADILEEDRRSRLKAMAEAEYALPDDKLRSFTMSRLRVWLQMDHEKAQSVATSYDAVMDRMSASIAMRRVGVVQTLAREFSLEDQERLRDLVPRVFGDQSTYSKRAAPPRPISTQPSVTRTKKPWWAFWKKQ